MRLKPLISHTGILMTFYLSIILDLQSWYIAAHVWKIYDFKIEVVPLIINFSTELTTVVKFEVLFQQDVGIPMGTNCAPLLADLFLYSYESEFLQKLVTIICRRSWYIAAHIWKIYDSKIDIF
jgi:uncharacterized metal-binding protein